MWRYVYVDELYHYGVKGMKWGVRRYQNKDGSLTAEGKKRNQDYADSDKIHLTESGHQKQVARRKSLTSEQSDVEIRKAYNGWFSNDDSNIGKIINGIRLHEEISDHSCNWYLSTPKSERTKKSYPAYKKANKNYWDVRDRLEEEYFKAHPNASWGECTNALERHPEFKNAKRTEREARAQIASDILSDLGYKDTKDARQMIYEIWRSD